MSVPDAPTGVSAVAGSSQASVVWAAPADNGASITSYTITSIPGGITAVTAATNGVVTGLTPGVFYTFTVYATNAFGNSTVSAQSNVIAPYTIPSAPTGASANEGINSATVSWTAPNSNGGSPITSYTVTSSPGGVTATSVGFTTLVTGLTAGVTYTFTIVATNAAGDSPPSTHSNSVTPYTVPSAPVSVTATAGNRQALLVWMPPANNGSSPITGYRVQSNPPGFNTTTAAAATSITITGLAVGTTYAFYVFATNIAGNSPMTLSNSVVPYTYPGIPTHVVAIAGVNQATVSWTIPAHDGSSPITGYTVTSDPEGIMTTVGSTSAIVTGLTPGTVYTFAVLAVNTAGAGGSSVPSNAVVVQNTLPPPTNVVAVPGNRSATLSWTPPAAGFVGFKITNSVDNTTVFVSAFTTNATIADLVNGTRYAFTVSAIYPSSSLSSSVLSNIVVPLTPSADGPTRFPYVLWGAQSTISLSGDTLDNPAVAAIGNAVYFAAAAKTNSVDGVYNIICGRLDACTGALLWLRAFKELRTPQGQQQPSIAVGGDNDVYVAYVTTGATPGNYNAANAPTFCNPCAVPQYEDIVIARINDADGGPTVAWVCQNATVNSCAAETAPKLACSGSGDYLYVVYETRGAPQCFSVVGTSNIVASCFTRAGGTQVWLNCSTDLNHAAVANTRPAVAADEEGMYVAWETEGRVEITKLAAVNGAALWSATLADDTCCPSLCVRGGVLSCAAVDDAGGIVMTGFRPPAGHLYSMTIPGPYDECNITCDNYGNVYLAANTTDAEIHVFKLYPTNGQLLWSYLDYTYFPVAQNGGAFAPFSGGGGMGPAAVAAAGGKLFVALNTTQTYGGGLHMSEARDLCILACEERSIVVGKTAYEYIVSDVIIHRQ